MRDDIHPEEPPRSPRGSANGASDAGDAEREVSLPRTRVLAPAVHAWLDGEGTLEAARRAGARDVVFWTRIEGVLAPRRAARAPRGFATRLIDTLR